MLVIIDVDDETNIPDNEIKPTLSTRSRSRTGTHHFYFATSMDSKLNIPTEEYGEVRSYWQYVVCPGSYVTCAQEEIDAMSPEQRKYAGQYTIERQTIPVSISFEEFPSVFKQHMADRKAQASRQPDMRTQVDTSGNKSALFNLTITDVLGTCPTNERFPSLFHGSKTGANTSISDNQVHCFMHNVSLTPLRALAVLSGIDTCMNAGLGHRRSNAGNSTIDLHDGKTVFTLWKYAKEQGVIPASDPIPTSALTWFTVSTGICALSDLEDGWRLPVTAYCKAKDALLAAKLLQKPMR
jgi:putative DNA primase/helicase